MLAAYVKIMWQQVYNSFGWRSASLHVFCQEHTQVAQLCWEITTSATGLATVVPRTGPPKICHFRMQTTSELETIEAQKTQKETSTFPQLPKRI